MLKPKMPLSSWRKISIGSWKPVGDSQVYSVLEVDCTNALKLIDDTKETKLTLTHIAGYAAAQMLKENPQINALIRFGNIYPRENVDIFFHIVGEDENDLSGHTIRNIDKKSILEIAEDLKPNVKNIKAGEDKEYKQIKKSMSLIPPVLTKCILDVLGFFMYSLNIWHKIFATPKDCFGSMMITNVGSLGLEHALVPLPPYARVPLILAVGKTYQKPVFNSGGNVVAQPTLKACWTFDHRLIDGAHGAKMAQSFRHHFENPHS